MCEVTATVRQRGLPRLDLLGVERSAARDAVTRLRSAFERSAVRWPRRPTIVEVSGPPARGDETWLDLPLAVAIAGALGEQVPTGGDETQQPVFFGGVAPEGQLRPTRGVVAAVRAAERAGRPIVIPPASIPWLVWERADHAFVAGQLREVLARAWSAMASRAAAFAELAQPTSGPSASSLAASIPCTWSDVIAQEAPKRALAAALAGGHSALLWGPPGCGKSSLVRGAHLVLPPPTEREWQGLFACRSHAGDPIPTARPVAIIPAACGMVSWEDARGGVLIVEELDRQSRAVIDALMAGLEHSGSGWSGLHDPLAPIVLATTNRSPEDLSRRVPAGLLDRLPLVVEVGPVTPEAATAPRASISADTWPPRVAEARRRQFLRQGNLNRALAGTTLTDAISASSPAASLLRCAARDRGMSVRAIDEVRRVARTVADLERSDEVNSEHVLEALSWRWSAPQGACSPSGGATHSIMPGAKPRRMAFSQHTRGSTNCSR